MPVRHINSTEDADIRIQVQGDDSYTSIGVIDRNLQVGMNGYFARLDRDEINQLIIELRSLRELRYGQDA